MRIKNDERLESIKATALPKRASARETTGLDQGGQTPSWLDRWIESFMSGWRTSMGERLEIEVGGADTRFLHRLKSRQVIRCASSRPLRLSAVISAQELLTEYLRGTSRGGLFGRETEIVGWQLAVEGRATDCLGGGL